MDFMSTVHDSQIEWPAKNKCMLHLAITKTIQVDIQAKNARS